MGRILNVSFDRDKGKHLITEEAYEITDNNMGKVVKVSTIDVLDDLVIENQDETNINLQHIYLDNVNITDQVNIDIGNGIG